MIKDILLAEAYDFFDTTSYQIEDALFFDKSLSDFEQGKILGYIEAAIDIFAEPFCPINSEDPWTEQNIEIARNIVKAAFEFYEEKANICCEGESEKYIPLLWDGLHEMLYNYLRLYTHDQ